MPSPWTTAAYVAILLVVLIPWLELVFVVAFVEKMYGSLSSSFTLPIDRRQYRVSSA